jgi:hypothetical protein
VAHEFTPVFIGGSGRSGTTILLNLLSRHPDFHASMPREIKYLTSRHGLVDFAFTRPLELEENLKAKRNNVIARLLPLFGKSKVSLLEHELFGNWWSETGKSGNQRGLIQGISRDQLDQGWSLFKGRYRDDPVGASRLLFETLSMAQMHAKPQRYFGDSTPVNIMQADLLYQLLPGSKFINVVRDGRDVAASVVKEKWGPTEHFGALQWWSNRIVKGHRALSKIPRDNWLQIRIEDLVAHQREATLKQILDFLEIPQNSKQDAYFADAIIPEKLHAGRWKSEPIDVVRFNTKYQEVVDQLNAQGIAIKEL